METALVLMLLVTLTFAAIEYGWLFTSAGYVTNAARQGARIGARPDATSADVQSAVNTLMNNVGMGSSGYSVTLSPSDVTSLTPGQALSVTVSVPYNNIEITGFPLLPLPANLRSQATMAKEGP